MTITRRASIFLLIGAAAVMLILLYGCSSFFLKSPRYVEGTDILIREDDRGDDYLVRIGESSTTVVDAVLSGNIASAPGRELFQRVRVERAEDGWRAEPVLGRSGLLRSIVQGHGLVRVPLGSEGLDAGTRIEVLLVPGAWP